MDCYSFDKIISDYIDSGLSVRQQQEANEHIAACERCRNKLADMIKMLSAIRSLPCCTTRPGFESRLMARIAQEQQKKEAPFPGMIREYSHVISVAAAVILLFATSLFVYTSVVLPGQSVSPPAADIRSIESGRMSAPSGYTVPGPELVGTNSEKNLPDSSKTERLNYNRRIMMVNE
jgi:anti-sigma factor RsiW